MLIKNGTHADLNTKIVSVFLNTQAFKDIFIKYKCSCCNKNYQKKFDENVKRQVFNTYKIFNHDINKFILLLQKGVYPYEYMGD